VQTFWRRLDSLTVLDPTCGSGAFLVAALHVLESLARNCLSRMKQLGLRPPCRPEQIRGRIVARNLFGVELLPEVVTSCRQVLRDAAASDDLPSLVDHVRVGNAVLGSLKCWRTAAST
jgi:23S rRNA G2445 N2-methylase RlmL